MNAPNPPPSRTLVVLAFAAIYVVWGSTYLAIRVVVETLPPFCAAGVRFLIAGGLLYAFLRLRGGAKSSTAQWRHSAVAGGLLLVGGNGLVMWAEQHLSSGFTALLIALTPVWFAVLDWLRPGGAHRSETFSKVFAPTEMGGRGALKQRGGDLVTWGGRTLEPS